MSEPRILTFNEAMAELDARQDDYYRSIEIAVREGAMTEDDANERGYAVPDGDKMGKIAGYRKMTEAELGAFKQIKEAEERALRYLDDLRNEMHDLDPRWLKIGITHIQEGVMAILRAIARPQRISLPDD